MAELRAWREKFERQRDIDDLYRPPPTPQESLMPEVAYRGNAANETTKPGIRNASFAVRESVASVQSASGKGQRGKTVKLTSKFESDNRNPSKESPLQQDSASSPEMLPADVVAALSQLLWTHSGTSSRGTIPAASNAAGRAAFRGVCYKCGGRGHRKTECPQDARIPQESAGMPTAADANNSAGANQAARRGEGKGPVRCYKCQQLGHYVNKCTLGAQASRKCQGCGADSGTLEICPECRGWIRAMGNSNASSERPTGPA
ncbi:uncharacterized protein LOC131663351 [Phymastichus coffea]|uniref:uncharacterized protein LOC131663351 n=1 Tax=Phymastichus coffea TaxID=108790 RepID=UPI00273AFB70|nr:uncharacterized protein LOC131663351 [Phymastichus coffea]